MPPGVKVYQLAVGGGTQLMDEETFAATHTVTAAIEKELGRHAGVVLKQFPSPTAILDTSSDLAAAGLKDELEDTLALFEAVSASVLLHPYRDPREKQTFLEKLKNFDYSLGPDVQQFAKLAHADALIFVSGVDHILTGGRKALIALGVLGLAISPAHLLLAAVATAGAPEPETLSVALVDGKTGALLWYKVSGYGDLTDPDGAAALAERVFEDFPVGRRPTRENDRSGSPRLGGALQ